MDDKVTLFNRDVLTNRRFGGLLLMMTAAALMVFMSFANVALAQGSMQGNIATLKGEVIAVDAVHNGKPLTLVSGQIGQLEVDPGNRTVV